MLRRVGCLLTRSASSPGRIAGVAPVRGAAHRHSVRSASTSAAAGAGPTGSSGSGSGSGAVGQIATDAATTAPSPPSGLDEITSSLEFAASAGVDVPSVVADSVPWYSMPTQLVVDLIENVHLFSGVPYWEAIVLSTLAMRLGLLPLTLYGLKQGARLKAVRPDMEKLKVWYESQSSPTPQLSSQYQTELKSLFKKHKANPIGGLVLPFVQLPLFLYCFFGLQKMADTCPGFAEGGTLWFTDLAAADVTYALPLANAVSFLLMIEIGTGDVQTENNAMFKNVMRVMAVLMVPLTAHMPQV
jgi:membrane protein insertase Oxa1/YidC/SpoIIIJ